MTVLSRVARTQSGRRHLLFQKSNTKLGEGIHTFSIPAGKTCPHKTELCFSSCYALRGHYRHTSVRKAYRRTYRATQSPHFITRAVREIKRVRIKVLRVHAAGDFYNVSYANTWLSIFKACPETRFFLYSRSWRDPEIRRVLGDMSRLSNVRVFFSLDREMPSPGHLPANVRTAYLVTSPTDLPPSQADLAFLDYEVRGKVAKRLNGVLCCPAETVRLHCNQCRLCLDPIQEKDPRRLRRPAESAIISHRVELPMAA